MPARLFRETRRHYRREKEGITMRAIVVFAALLIAQSAFADEPNYGEFRFGVRVGHGDLNLDSGRPITQSTLLSNVSADVLGLGGTIEYHAPFPLVLEVGRFNTEEVDLFGFNSDPFRFRETFASVGWRIDLGRGFSLLPRAGRSRWEVHGDDEFFRDRDRDLDIRGYQNYWEIAGFKTIGDVVALGLSYKENNYRFGSAKLTEFTVMFRFGNGSAN
jgi:hypothetical protein